jgi:hypothetical protein
VVTSCVIAGKIERKEDNKEDVSSYWMILSKREGLLEFEIGITRSHCQVNTLCMRLYTSYKTDYAMNGFPYSSASSSVTF